MCGLIASPVRNAAGVWFMPRMAFPDLRILPTTQAISSGATGEEQDFFVAMANGKGFRKTVFDEVFSMPGLWS